MPAQTTPFTRAVIGWSILAALLIAALLATIGALRQTTYSPAGLVRAYLSALNDQDARAALALPGVPISKAELTAVGTHGSPSHELLRGDILPRIDDITVMGDTAGEHGRHRVSVAYTLDGTPARSTFTLERTGSIAGVLPTWRFATSPITVARITVEHASTFSIGGHRLDLRAATRAASASFTGSADYLVFTPGLLRLSHDSALLTSRTETTVVSRPDSLAKATVTARPTDAFTERVQTQLDDYLDSCVTQPVLQPTGCPMGAEIDDRVVGAPAWSMVAYPTVHLTAGDDAWVMPSTEATAHLTVKVQSIFDGSMSTRDTDEPFTVSLTRVTIAPDGSLAITVGG
ncbi:hypothetical protein OSC27_11100 [Microbacterium sp. STN6]|uniref:hypothetical protein n=1 Tax=Microbacterium sp. STN6 TaxID=2995588 RepID=UPI002260D61B|nr:hypothetical protein [Microbacterium sp. STN6]MCX7522821.1 hypothetical protein [Microbacterium sp. STN6]